MPGSVGYSGKPLFRKLGLEPGMRCLVVGGPDDYEDLIAGSEDITLVSRRSAPPPRQHFDVVHHFAGRHAHLQKRAAPALEAVAEGGMLWVSWPKKSSPAFVDLTEDGVRDVLLPTGWVDVKVCAVDATWSGLKFLRRKKTRK